jgi:hypothetical protein
MEKERNETFTSKEDARLIKEALEKIVDTEKQFLAAVEATVELFEDILKD